MLVVVERIVASGLAPMVFDYVADVTNIPKWQAHIEEAYWTSEQPIGVGSTYVQAGHLFGRQLSAAFEVTRFEPGQLIEAQSTSRVVELTLKTEVFRVAPTKVVVRSEVQGKLARLLGVLTPMMRRAAIAAATRDHAVLKTILDARWEADPTRPSRNR